MGGGFSSGGGLFGNILGPNFLGLTGRGSESEQTTELDPTTRALNNFRLRSLQQAGFNAQNLFGAPEYAYGMSPQAQNFANQIQQYAQQPGIDPGQWFNQTWSQLNPTYHEQRLADIAAGNQAQLQQNLQDYMGAGTQNLQGALQSYLAGGGANLQGTLQNYLDYGTTGIGNARQQQLDYINNQLAPSMLGAGNQYYNAIVGPQVGADYSLMGLGRSGGRQEAEAKAAASVALPIQQQLAAAGTGAYSQYASNLANLIGSAYGQYGTGMQNLLSNAYGQYGTGLQNLTNAAYGQYGQLTGQNQLANFGAQSQLDQNALQNLYGLNMAYPQVAANIQQAQMQRLGQGFTAADYQRSLRQQGFQGSQNAFLSAFNATPYTPATTVKTSGTGNEGLLNTAFAAGVGGGLGAAAGSDRRFKDNVKVFDAAKLLDELEAYTFTYKTQPEERFAGVMAQDLEATELGKRFVQSREDGKYIVFTPELLNLMLACIVNQHKRIKDLENAAQ